MTNILLANLIRLFHIVIILFIFIVPFTNKSGLLVLHIVFSLTILFHWICNSDVCCLSLFESQLRGIEYTDTFIHEFIAPIYNISTQALSRLCYIIIITLMVKSIWSLWYHPRFQYFISQPSIKNSLGVLSVNT